MADDRSPLIRRFAGLSFQTKLFVVAVIYMLAMFGLSEGVGGDAVLRLWFASALPVVWALTLLLQWLSMSPRPAFGDAVAEVVASARLRPLVSLFYVLAAVVIEMQAIAWALGRSLIPGL